VALGVSRTARNNGVSRRTVYRWRHRPDELVDRSCRPRRSPRRTADQLEAALLGLRLELRWGPDRLGPYLGVPASTAYAVLRRWNAARLRTLFPTPRPTRGRFGPVQPGYVALDVKSLGRLDRGGGRRGPHHSVKGTALVGYRHLHVALDLASRLVYAELRAGLGTADCLAFLQGAIAFFDARGIRVRRVLLTTAPDTCRASAPARSGWASATPAPNRAIRGRTAGSRPSTERSSASACMRATSAMKKSVALRSRSSSPTTTPNVRTPHSVASVRSSGYALRV
jgi:hypothetical protein